MPRIAEIEFTPNPNARKFILREPLTPQHLVGLGIKGRDPHGIEPLINAETIVEVMQSGLAENLRLVLGGRRSPSECDVLIEEILANAGR